MRRLALTSVSLLLFLPFVARAGTVNFVEGFESGVRFMDVFLTVTPRAEFTNLDIIITPLQGSLLDPIRDLPGNAGNKDIVTDGARLDTWVNTPLTSLADFSSGYVFIEYHPGDPPLTPPDSLPTPAGTPDQLNWKVFDTNTAEPGMGPFHIARFLYTPGGYGTVAVQAYDTITISTGGELFTSPYGIPEPASAALAGIGLFALIQVARAGGRGSCPAVSPHPARQEPRPPEC